MSLLGRRADLSHLTTFVGIIALATGAYLLADSLPSAHTPSPPDLPLPLVGSAPVVFEEDNLSSMATDSLELLDFDWEKELPGWRIHYLSGNGPVAGYTWSQEHLIEIFVRPGATPESLARVLAHEFGHAIDVTYNTPEERHSWLEARHAVGIDWWPGSGASDFGSGAGDFAECFAFWLVEDIDFRSTVAAEPTAEQLTVLESMAAP